MAVLVVIGVLILILVILPVSYNIRANKLEEEFDFSIVVAYGKGLIYFSYKGDLDKQEKRLKLLGVSVRNGGAEKNVDRHAGKTLREKICIIKKKRKLYKHILETAGEIMERILLRNTIISMKLGTGDPAYTGMLAGLAASFPSYFKSTVCFEPVFSVDTPEVDFSAKGAILPIAVFCTVIRHFFKYAVEEVVEGIRIVWE